MSRVALVTGGGRGIGLAIARRLLADGYRVAVTYRSSPSPEEPGMLAVACDVTDTEQVDAAFDQIEAELGNVEVLVSNAGITADMLVLRMSDDDFARVIDTNLAGALRVSRRAVQRMMRARWGRIILISSVVGATGNAGQGNYAASKAGMVGMSKSLAAEVASRGITVNCVAPGFITTAMTDKLNEEQKGKILGQVPAGRMGTSEEIAAAVLYLSSVEAGYVTGTVLHVNGGMAMM